MNHCLNHIGLEATLHLVMTISLDINLKLAKPRDASRPSTAVLLVPRIFFAGGRGVPNREFCFHAFAKSQNDYKN